MDMRQILHLTTFRLFLAIIQVLFLSSTLLYSQSPGRIRFGVIGDYGNAGQPESDVANLVKGWNPDLIITTGDNNYELGAASTIDQNIGQYYHEFIFPYAGTYGQGDTVNRFFPSLGNHDWNTPGAAPYLNYFTLPGNERYYEFVRGPVHFFAIDSDGREPDGNSSTSTQGNWLKARLAASTARWKMVYMHHPPYSSGSVHGSTSVMQWPFRQWGATAVLAGHDHTYERLIKDSLVYFVNGLGGRSIYSFGTPIAGSVRRYKDDYGAMLVEASADSIMFRFITRTGAVIDSFTVRAIATSVTGEDYIITPEEYMLWQNYPNPFNPSTRIRFGSGGSGLVWLKVYDMLGREVATLLNEVKQPGEYAVEWNASGLSSGVYIYRLEAPDALLRESGQRGYVVRAKTMIFLR